MSKFIKRCFSLVLSLTLLFNIVNVPAPVHANSIAIETGYGVDVTGDITELAQQAQNALKGFSSVELADVYNLVGSNIMLYLSAKGLVWSGVEFLKATENLGAFVIQNWNELSDTFVQHISGIILTKALDPNYYDTKKMKITNNILSGIDSFFGNYVGASTIALNVGLQAQTVIPDDILVQMSDTLYDSYSLSSHCIYNFIKITIRII